MPEPLRILVVDDEFSIVASLREILEWEGFAVDTAPNGRLGLEAAQARKPDVVLLDVMMPVMDGLAMLRGLKENQDTQAIPVILMSAAPIRVPPARGGYFAALPKPFDVKSVLKCIREATRNGKP
jgi:DNA-binding response OmpR family regulator